MPGRRNDARDTLHRWRIRCSRRQPFSHCARCADRTVRLSSRPGDRYESNMPEASVFPAAHRRYDPAGDRSSHLSGHPPDKTSPRLRFLCQFSLSGPVPISSRLFIPGTSTMNHRRPDPQVFGQNTNILTCLRRCQHHVLQPQFLLPEFLQEKYSSALSMRFSLS